MGIINALGNTMGFVAPMIVGDMINNHNDQEHWQVRMLVSRYSSELMIITTQQVFWIAAEVYSFGTLMFIIFGSAKEQHWNRDLYMMN